MPVAEVFCACGKSARRFRHGRTLDPKTLKATKAKARALNAHGHPFIHACGDCGEDFGGKTLLKNHRTGRGNGKRCLTPDEMSAKGWRKDDKSRWRDLRNGSVWGTTTSLEVAHSTPPATLRPSEALEG